MHSRDWDYKRSSKQEILFSRAAYVTSAKVGGGPRAVGCTLNSDIGSFNEIMRTTFQSNGEDSKEACYKECAEVCNQERKRVEAAIWGTDFFQYVIDQTIPWDSWLKDGDCYDWCSSADASGC